MTLGERIKERRESKGMSQQELGRLAKRVSGAYIEKIESGIETNPPYLVKAKINFILGDDLYNLSSAIKDYKSIRLVDLNLQGISPSDELLKVQEENKEFEMAVLECLCNPIEENKLHAIEEFWDEVQSSLSYLQITLGIKADEVMENYHLHLEKIKNRPR